MENGEWIGVVTAIAVGALAFGISRFVTQRITQRRAEKAQAMEKATQSRQVRRANERRKK